MRRSGSGGVLPPLPGSDQESLDKNRYDGFYGTRARDFWGENEIHRFEERPDKKCQHKFKAATGGVICTRCNFGLMGPLEVRDGDLYFNKEKISFE